MKIRQPGILVGSFAAAMLTAALTAIFFFGWKVAGLPFVPFDTFDWLTRVLPGRLLTFAISTMVSVIRTLNIGPTAETAKTAEQAMAIASLFIVCVLGGIVLVLILRTTRTGHGLTAGLTLGVVVGVPVMLILSIASSPLCWGQATRTAEIERQRDEKTARLSEDKPGKVEKTLAFIKDEKVLERISAGYHGLNVRFGGLVQGSGFALGPEYRLRSDFQGGSTFRVGAQLSTKVYQKYYARWTLPNLAHKRLFLDFNAAHRNYPEIDYFGSGPRSLERNRTDYRLEDTAVDGAFGVNPWKHLRLGGSAGYLWVNVGPGQADRRPSTDQVFPPSVAPGVDRQTNFLRYGPFAQIDYLDNPASPASGGLYTFQYMWYQDQNVNLHDFQRIDAEIQQYFGFFNKTRVLAFRAKTTLTDADRGQTIPFYMQSIIGGSEDLRGFRPFRFYDNNSLVLNAEYLFHVLSVMDMAVFADGGKVFPRRGQLNFSNLEGDGGVGFRFNVKGEPFLRIDLAASHEGFQIWLMFNDIFVRHPVGTASAQPIPR